MTAMHVDEPCTVKVFPDDICDDPMECQAVFTEDQFPFSNDSEPDCNRQLVKEMDLDRLGTISFQVQAFILGDISGSDDTEIDIGKWSLLAPCCRSEEDKGKDTVPDTKILCNRPDSRRKDLFICYFLNQNRLSIHIIVLAFL